MKVAFVSNFMNNHQKGLCEAFISSLGNDGFKFIATQPVDEGLAKVSKYSDMNQLPFVKQAYVSKELEDECMDIARDADILITAPYMTPDYLSSRFLKTEGLTFIYSERILKRGRGFRFFPPKRARVREGFTKYKDDPRVHVLCASAFTASDLALFGFPIERCWKWGYFPKVDVAYESTGKTDQRRHRLLWCGRFIDWKRPFWPLRLARELHAAGIDFVLTMVGDGPLHGAAEDYALKHGLTECVSFTGAIPSNEVSHFMVESDVLLVTSTRKEGWGAVVNEAMQCGCAVVSGHLVGSAPYLIESGISGLIYKTESFSSFSRAVFELLSDEVLLKSIKSAAPRVISEEWSAQCAVHNFIKLCSYLKGEDSEPPLSGPASRAGVFQEDWQNNVGRRV